MNIRVIRIYQYVIRIYRIIRENNIIDNYVLITADNSGISTDLYKNITLITED